MTEEAPHRHIGVPLDRDTIEMIIADTIGTFDGPLKGSTLVSIEWIDGLPHLELRLPEDAYQTVMGLKADLLAEIEDTPVEDR